ncbi:GNAT family N-acetyltransferase [Fulvivirgaceae bacterium PWU4]|uniref:GNAT family N-acetyltransferase n=1 Tax=Chryseosolibacter histidini TaxID=2782349 RepID=A0AAP2GLL8_9BACT|nr:GNAT family N-acetyltransferase [Chryseosolibacter histidini]MBT1700254.1 GNAT family N-acetyltransferase [Chryseosolibacter histidini]
MNYSTPVILETPRLYLRQPREDDWRQLHAYYGDAECMKYTAGKAMTEWESWRKLASLIGHWQMRKYGSYALEERSTGNVIGVAGIEFPMGWPDPEIQWGLSRDFWRKGYASEAVKAIKNMADEFVPTLPLISIIHPGNVNSTHVARAAGASFEREFLFRDDTWHIYRHSAPSR